MGRLLGVLQGPDSAHAALVVGGIAIALGGTALFGIVAHTRTPWSTQRVVGLVPLDSLSPADFVVPLPTVALKGKRPEAIPAGPESLSQGESVVVLPKPVELTPVADASLVEPRPAQAQVVPARNPEMEPAENVETKSAEPPHVES